MTSIHRPHEMFLRYAAAGALGTAAHYTVLATLLGLMGPVPASTLGAMIGCVVNFSLASRYVFATRVAASRSFPRFLAVAALGIAVNALLLGALVVALPVFVSQVLATCGVLGLGYTLNKRWSFNAC